MTKSIAASVTEVSVERVFNLGNYESIRIGFKATIGPENPDVEKTLASLDKATIRYADAMYPDRKTRGGVNESGLEGA